MKTQLKRFQRGTILTTEIKIIRVLFLAKLWLPFIYVLRICLRLIGKVISLVEEISRQPNVDSALELLVITLCEDVQQKKQTVHNVQFGIKRNIRRLNVGTMACAER